jgi:hypothetical protein
VSHPKLENAIGLLFAYDSGQGDHLRSFGVRTEGISERCVVADTFIPIYPDTLPTVPKPSRASRTASLVFSNLPASQSAITRFFAKPLYGLKPVPGVRIPPSPPDSVCCSAVESWRHTQQRDFNHFQPNSTKSAGQLLAWPSRSAENRCPLNIQARLSLAGRRQISTLVAGDPLALFLILRSGLASC